MAADQNGRPEGLIPEAHAKQQMINTVVGIMDGSLGLAYAKDKATGRTVVLMIAAQDLPDGHSAFGLIAEVLPLDGADRYEILNNDLTPIDGAQEVITGADVARQQMEGYGTSDVPDVFRW